MNQTKDYRDNAEECRAIAANMRISDLREQVLDLARQWDQLAADREKLFAIRAKMDEISAAPTAEVGRRRESTEPRPAPASNGSRRH